MDDARVVSPESSEEFGNIVTLPAFRHGQPGYYSLALLPQRESIEGCSFGTGYDEMDQLLKFYPGQFIVVTGIPGHGKSTFLQNICVNVARKYGARSFLFAPENEGFIREKMRKIWGHGGGFEYFSKEQCFIQSSIPDGYDSEPRSVGWILDKAAVACKSHLDGGDDCSLVIIDPWNEIERACPKGMNPSEFIGECLLWFKQFARFYGVTVALVCHPTKSGATNAADGAVTLADIDGSMHFYNRCDNGLIVVREPGTNSSRVISAKVREMGAGRVGAAYFTVDPATGKFSAQYGAVT